MPDPLILTGSWQKHFRLRTFGGSFRSWEESGEMAFYRAHFILDDVHWIWYAGLFTTALCRLFDRHGVAHKYDWVLLLPPCSGLLDWYENQLQHVFLSASDFATIVDPLPLFSTVASDVKSPLGPRSTKGFSRLVPFGRAKGCGFCPPILLSPQCLETFIAY